MTGSTAGGIGATGISATSTKLHNIQILRFVAAVAVVLSHAAGNATASFGRSIPLRPDLLGATGVLVFFIISGFIMVHSTRGRFGAPGAAADFLSKRAIRIVPIYWIATLVALGVILFGSGRFTSCSQMDPAYLMSSFLFVAHPRCDGEVQPLLTQGWTLNYEVLFYLAFAVALLFRRPIGCALLAAAFASLAGVGTVLRGGAGPAPGDVVLFYTDAIVLFFIVGVAAALLHERVNPLPVRFPGTATMTCAVLILLLAVDVAVPYSSDAGQPHALSWILSLLVFALLAFVAVPSHARIAPLLELLGDASYSLYLFHIVALTAAGKIWVALHLGAHPLAFVAAGTVASLAAGVLVHRLVERPLVGVLRGWAKLPRRPVEFGA